MTDCQLNVAPFFQCCCHCQNQVKVFHSCTPETHSQDLCYTLAGYGCYIDEYQEELQKVFFPIGLHSCGCEMYRPRKGKK